MVCGVGCDPWVRRGFAEERINRVQDWAEVHWLFFREGWPKAKICDDLGMFRNEVSRLLGCWRFIGFEWRAADSKPD